MRKGFKYDLVPPERVLRTTLDATAAEFAESEHYGERRFADADQFLAAFGARWVLELHDVLRELLAPERRVLSIGSGLGEHEVRLYLAGYHVVASDIVPGVLDQAVALFPGFEGRELDIFEPGSETHYDDVLVNGLGYAYTSDRMLEFLHSARTLLTPGGRVILVARYNDNLATLVLDRILWPLMARYSRTKARLRGRRLRVVRRHYGYRRSRRETVALARAAGFTIGRVRYSGFGLELERLGLESKLPRTHALARTIDRRLRVLNNATTFELLTDP